MADILVHNTLKDIEASLNVKNGLVLDALTIRNAVDATLASIDYSGEVQYSCINLSRLSCNTEIAMDVTNYAGSGSGGVVGGSAWEELKEVNTTTLYHRLTLESGMSNIISQVDDIESGVLKNNVKQYIELYARQQIEKLAETDIKVKYYWLPSSQGISIYSYEKKICCTCYGGGLGANCLWTVPGGTSEVKFQVWGAGAGTNPGCCCGGAPFGANGAYSELTLNVTPGDQYCICAGCSCAISCCSSTNPGCACMSGVTGPGICCLKADGGSIYNCCIMNCASQEVNATPTGPKFTSFYSVANGANWCSQGSYCFSSNQTCGIVPVHANCTGSVGNWCACGTDTTEISKGGHKSLHGGGCLDPNGYGYHTRPPILDSDTCREYQGGCSCGTFTSGTCCGGCNGNTWTRHPGMGGAHTHVMSGTNTHMGGIGAGGMVKVSWR